MEFLNSKLQMRILRKSFFWQYAIQISKYWLLNTFLIINEYAERKSYCLKKKKGFIDYA